jgi:hypothetical protein
MNLNFPVLNNRTIISLDQFLTNPTGKGSSMMGKREEIKKNLQQRYYKILKNAGGHFTYNVYIDKNVYLFYFKIPSETYEMEYDVLLEFYPHNPKLKKFKDINDYSLNFFSNSPHMMFTYTYVLHQNKITIPMLMPLYSHKALTQKPKVTNPIQIFGFEKSCYYAAMYIKENKLFTKSVIEKNATVLNRVNKAQLIKSIATQENKFIEYNKNKQSANKDKKKAKTTNTNKTTQTTNRHPVIKKMITPVKKNKVSSPNKKLTSKPKVKNTKSNFKSVFKKKK